MKRFLPDETATTAFGQELLNALPEDLAGWTILLTGELGAGKSTLARAFIKAECEVADPFRIPGPA